MMDFGGKPIGLFPYLGWINISLHLSGKDSATELTDRQLLEAEKLSTFNLTNK